MKAFEFASPTSETEVLEILAESRHAEVLAGGTDLVGLMKKMLVTPDRVVSLDDVPSLRVLEGTSEGLRIGAMVTLEELLDSGLLEPFAALRQAIEAIRSQQLLAQGTIGGELCQRPRCWYFRAGQGLLARGGKLVEEGDNRYHAIFGNAGAAKFVNPSRLAPALIVLGARLRIIGPNSGDELLLPLSHAQFFRTPYRSDDREIILEPGQIITHIDVPITPGTTSAHYEVQHGSGPDYPLAAAAARLRVVNEIVREARIVMGQVAPLPWCCGDAERAIIGKPVTIETAEAAGAVAVESATPLSGNRYKVQLAKVAVKRAILLAAGLPTGGF